MANLAYGSAYQPLVAQPWSHHFSGQWPFGKGYDVGGVFTGGILHDMSRSAGAPPYPHTEDMIGIGGYPYYLTTFGRSPRFSPIHAGELVWLEPNDWADARFSTQLR
jgi:hypothetical protein